MLICLRRRLVVSVDGSDISFSAGMLVGSPLAFFAFEFAVNVEACLSCDCDNLFFCCCCGSGRFVTLATTAAGVVPANAVDAAALRARTPVDDVDADIFMLVLILVSTANSKSVTPLVERRPDAVR